MLDMLIPIGVSVLGFAGVWGALKNQVKNNEDAIKHNTVALEEVTKKWIPLERENAMAEVTIAQLKDIVVDLKDQLCELKDVVQTLRVEIEVMKNKD
jgi:predicted nuclease with TOPRIM domain